jgi:hypothetical protein
VTTLDAVEILARRVAFPAVSRNPSLPLIAGECPGIGFRPFGLYRHPAHSPGKDWIERWDQARSRTISPNHGATCSISKLLPGPIDVQRFNRLNEPK